MTDRPILFSAPMVRALIEGRKTQTRRILKPQPDTFEWPAGKECLVYPFKVDGEQHARIAMGRDTHSGVITTQRVPFEPGDRLWVRETFNQSGMAWPSLQKGLGRLHYRADPDHGWQSYWGDWRPSLFMPRWASRLTLIVTEVRIERLQSCSEADAIAEGVERDEFGCFLCYASGPNGQTYWADPRESYRTLWDHINGPGAWEANPWVVAVSFTVHQCNIDQMEAAA